LSFWRFVIETVLIVAGGDPLPPSIVEELPERAYVIAADSGLDRAQGLGLEVHLVVGDLDSVSKEALAEVADLPIERHPVDKDATDLELAIKAAVRLDPARVIVLGGIGGRLDHLLANAMVLASPQFGHLEMEWLTPGARMHVVTSSVRLHGSTGDLVSLIPMAGNAGGVTTRGLRWPLTSAQLPFGTTQGVSNEMTGPVATISVGQGTLLAVHLTDWEQASPR
jgi:thiamine pyrophosphokinase